MILNGSTGNSSQPLPLFRFPPVQILTSILLRKQFSNSFSFSHRMEEEMGAPDLFYSNDSITEMTKEISETTVPSNVTYFPNSISYQKFDLPEYGVFGAVLLLSAAIGVFYGCFGKGQKSTEAYLFADRQLATIPAALSLLCR
jgi:hypothetical protein